MLILFELVAGDVSTDGKWCFLIIKVAWHGAPKHCTACQCSVACRRPVASHVARHQPAVDLCYPFTFAHHAQVGLTSGMPAHWRLLKSRLEALCPTSTGNMWMRQHRNGAVDTEHPFLLQVSSYDRVGVLHGARLGPSCRVLAHTAP